MPTTSPTSGTGHMNNRMQQLSRHMLRNAEVARGEAFPPLPDLLTGICPYKDSLAEDIEVWCLKLLADDALRMTQTFRTSLELFRKLPNKATASALLTRVQTVQGLSAFGRIAWYAAVMGDMKGWAALRTNAVGNPVMLLYLHGLREHAASVDADPALDRTAVSWGENRNLDILRLGAAHAAAEIDAIEEAATFVSLWDEGPGSRSRQTHRHSERRKERAGFDAFVPEVPATAEDFPDPDIGGDPAIEAFVAATAAASSGLVVLRKPKTTGTREQKDFIASFETIADKPLPWLRAHGVAGVRERMLRAWPHAADVVDRLLMPLREGEPARFDPVILVGDPGSGKSRLMREISAAFGLPVNLYPCGSVADGSFAGTPAQWSSKRVSIPLGLVRSSGHPNPVVILDELEKTPPAKSGANGSLLSAILPFVDREMSSKVFDTALETNVDLSMVSYLATSNDASLLPPEVRDRFTLLRMPNPKAEHVPVLARRIMDDHAHDMDVDPRFLPDLEQDEMRILVRAWDGGSIRKLKAAVKATIEARSAHGAAFAN